MRIRFGITGLLISIALAPLIVRAAMWEPILGGLAGAAWLAGVWSHVASGDSRYGWLRGALAGLFWFAVSPILIVTAIWLLINLPPLFFGTRDANQTRLLGSVASWAPYAQAIFSGIAGGLTAIRIARRQQLDFEQAQAN